jgi:hypothetical protein
MLKIVTADERLAQLRKKTSALVLGPPKVGKTSLLKTLPEDTTLALDFEAGMKSVQSWKGQSIELRTLADTWDVVCLLGGPNPAVSPNKPFSSDHYAHVVSKYGSAIDTTRYRTLFFDSVSDLSHVARIHAEQQPAAFNKYGVYNPMGMYGELGRSLVDLFTHLQHAPMNIIFVGKLDEKKDDAGRVTYEAQIEGQMAGRVLPGLVDIVVSMSLFDYDEKAGWQHNFHLGKQRAFCCHRINPWGLPAGNRSPGAIDLIEEPHLGHLLDKVNLLPQSAAAH